jgi:hypothetical protein
MTISSVILSFRIAFFVHDFRMSRARAHVSRRGRQRSQDDPQMPHPSVPSVSELRGPNFEELGNH